MLFVSVNFGEEVAYFVLPFCFVNLLLLLPHCRHAEAIMLSELSMQNKEFMDDFKL